MAIWRRRCVSGGAPSRDCNTAVQRKTPAAGLPEPPAAAARASVAAKPVDMPTRAYLRLSSCGYVPHIPVRREQLRAFAKRLWADQSGATAIEYGLIAALISVVVITAVTKVGTNLKGTFNNVANGVK